jgi:hypothetical protein
VLKIDARQFNATLKRAIAASSSAAADVVNKKAYLVAVNAAHACKIGNKERIMYVLGKAEGPAAPTKSGKAPKAKWRQLVYREDSFAARIINARRVDAGKNPLHGRKLDERIRKLIIARGASVGWIASCFVRAARQLRRYAKGVMRSETPKGIKVIPTGKSGKGHPSITGTFGSIKTARVEIDVVLRGGKFQAKGMGFNPEPIAAAAFQAGMEIERRDMEKHMKDKLEKELRKAGAL